MLREDGKATVVRYRLSLSGLRELGFQNGRSMST